MLRSRRAPTPIAASLTVLAPVCLAVMAMPSTAPAGAVEPVRSDTGIELRPLTTSADPRIVDDLGREVLLRGANVNALGRYRQGVPALPANLPVTEGDWDIMAAHGFSVIRLIITWSRLEPTRGVIDRSSLDRVETYVDAAAAHGIHTVIDMHQDAWTDTISTTDPAGCPIGTTPAKGRDGAPARATITDGLSTCLTAGDRNSSPAVTAAGADFDHIVFVEPGIRAADLSRGIIVPDPGRIGLGTANVVAAPHNYAESIIGGFTIEQMSDLFDGFAARMGLPVWVGEYGFWDTSPATPAKVRRYAANEDAKAQGGAWWQWRQSCGDPHSVQWSGGTVVSPDHRIVTRGLDAVSERVVPGGRIVTARVTAAGDYALVIGTDLPEDAVPVAMVTTSSPARPVTARPAYTG